MTKTTQNMDSFSFRKGYDQVKRKDIVAVRSEIMEALGLNTRMAFYQRMWGKVIPKVTEAKAIEQVFAKYGIKQIWGDN